jgi:hypothetical protein
MHWAITSLGLLMMNKGEPITGKGKRSKGTGSRDMAAGLCDWLKRVQRQRGHTLCTFDDAVTHARHFGENVVSIKAGGGDFGLHKWRIIATL